MVAFLTALLYGLLEAVTEWLPVSSTGHMILLSRWLPLCPTGVEATDQLFYSFFEVFVQLGAVLAVPCVYFPRLFPKNRTLSLWAKVAAATLPCALAGALLNDFVEAYLHSPFTVAVALIGYGLVFWRLDTSRRRPRPALSPTGDFENISLGAALLVGAFQVLALVPGTSRSGATILGGLLAGLTPAAATEFSFLLAIPAMCGASLWRGLSLLPAFSRLTPLCHACLLGGFLAAFCVSLVAVRRLSDFVKRRGFTPFAVYRMVIGAVILATIYLF